jgi:hypothetical protein
MQSKREAASRRVWALCLGLLAGGCRFSVAPLPFGVGAPDLGGGGSGAKVPPGVSGGIQDLALSQDLTASPDLLTASPDLLTASPDLLTASPDLMVVPLLVGSWTASPLTANLTASGTLDWAHWGATGDNDFNHKKGANLISNATLVGDPSTNAKHQYQDNDVAFSWSNGTPLKSATYTTTGVDVSGIGNGFRLNVPAGPAARTLQLYISAHQAAGQLIANLSDGSGAVYTDSFSDQGIGNYRLYTFVYRSATASLEVTWTQTLAFVADPSANITLQAATLAQ